jgi:hypothetical protein
MFQLVECFHVHMHVSSTVLSITCPKKAEIRAGHKNHITRGFIAMVLKPGVSR